MNPFEPTSITEEEYKQQADANMEEETRLMMADECLDIFTKLRNGELTEKEAIKMGKLVVE